MGTHTTMRSTFITAILLLPLLIALAGCGGGSQATSVLITDPEAIALRAGDVPMNFAEVEGSAMHITNADSCAGTQGDEQQECLSQLEQWGRLDGYEVEYAAVDPSAFLTGTYRIFGAVSIYRDQKGASEAFSAGKDRLHEELTQLEDADPVQIPTVGDESLAFVTTANQTVGSTDMSVSLYVVDFRRGNVLVRIGATAPTVLASVDDALKRAETLDARILQVASEAAPTVTPEGSATVSPAVTPEGSATVSPAASATVSPAATPAATP
jgi:hypothetical protein